MVLDKYELKGGDTAPAVSGVFTILDENVKNEATYTSSNSNVIEINASTGEMTVKGIGTATITASYDGKTATKDVTVSYSDDFSVTSSLSMTENQSAALSDNPFGIDPFIGEFSYTITPTNDSPSDGLAISGSTLTASKAGTYTVTVLRHDDEEESKWTSKTVNVTVMEEQVTTNGFTYVYPDPITTDKVIKVTFKNEGTETVKFGGIYGATPSSAQSSDPGNGWVRDTNADETPNEYWIKYPYNISSLTPNAETTVTIPVEVALNEKSQLQLWWIQNTDSADLDKTTYPLSATIEVLSNSGGGSSSTETMTITSFEAEKWYDISNYFYANSSEVKVPKQIQITFAGEGGDIQAIIHGDFTQGGWVATDIDYQHAGVKVSTSTAIFDVEKWNLVTSMSNAKVLFHQYGSVPVASLTFIYDTSSDEADSVTNTQSRSCLTRFTASSLRMSTARALAAELDAIPEETQTGITQQEQQSMEEHGYFDRTISDKNNWKITLPELPQYFVKADGTVASYYYWAEEISGAEGYKAGYSFTDSDDTTSYSINASNSGDSTIHIKNMLNQTPSSTTLPTSGSTGTRVYYVTGAMLLLLAAAGYATYKRRRWSSE